MTHGLPGWERLRHGGLLPDGARFEALARSGSATRFPAGGVQACPNVGEAMQSNRLLGAERNAPPHFAGRADELNRLAGYAEYVFRNSDPSGGIVLIDGVPGSGKTQLMRRFVERRQAGGNGVLALAVTTADIPEDARSLMFLIASAMPVGKRKALGIVGEERRAKSLSFAGLGKFDWDNPTVPDLPITEIRHSFVP